MQLQNLYNRAKAKDEEYLKDDRLRLERKQRQVIRSMFEPVLPKLCKRLYQCMILFTVLGLLVELAAAVRSQVDALLALAEMLLTASVVWSLTGIFLLIVSLIQLIRLKTGYEEQEYYFADELSEEEKGSCQCVSDATDNPQMVLYAKTAQAEAKRRYLHYIKVTCAGFVFLFMIMLLTGTGEWISGLVL